MWKKFKLMMARLSVKYNKDQMLSFLTEDMTLNQVRQSTSDNLFRYSLRKGKKKINDSVIIDEISRLLYNELKKN